jgi:hypothetical protein
MTDQKQPTAEQVQALTAAIERLAFILEKISPWLADLADAAMQK